MKKTLSKLKVNSAYYFFRRPINIPLTPVMRSKIRQAKELFNHLCDEEIVLEATKKFRVYSFNSLASRKAVVVHGWMSQSLYMIKLIETLVIQGFHVVAIDLPGHGKSPSGRISWMDSVNAIMKTQEHYGEFELGLGHSYGGSLLLSSMGVSNVVSSIKDSITLKNLVMIASPAKVQTAVNLFSSTMLLTPEEEKAFVEKIEKDSGASLNLLDGLFLQTEFPTDTHIHCIHDQNDKIVPFADSEYLSQLGDRVSVTEIEDVGHLKIVYDTEVMKKLVEYLKSHF